MVEVVQHTVMMMMTMAMTSVSGFLIDYSMYNWQCFTMYTAMGKWKGVFVPGVRRGTLRFAWRDCVIHGIQTSALVCALIFRHFS